MQAVLETATSKVLYLFEDGLSVVITSTQMTSPLRALDIKSGTHHVLEGVSKPEYFFGGLQSYISDVWAVLDPPAYDVAKAVYLVGARASVCDAVKNAMYTRLNQGVIYKLNNGSTPYPVQIDEGMQNFLSYASQLLQQGVLDPHDGKIVQGDVEFSINDLGLKEFVKFTGQWGLKINQIKIAEDAVVKTMTSSQLDAYNPSTINWAIRDATIGSIDIKDWTQDEKDKGWSNDTMLQNP